MEAALALVERLVATVARAFYNDTTVVVLDILSRESYLRYEEIAPRLRLAEKDVKKALTQLESEWLIRCEDNLMEDQRNSKCWYIDYQLFVNVVRFRINCMQQEIKVKDSSKTLQLQFQCPTCHSIWSELEVQRSISRDHKFVCSNCCPSNNIREVTSEKAFALVPIDFQSKLKLNESLERKMNEQMNESELHDGIYSLLAQLRDIPLPTNRPSSNMKCGFLSSSVSNAETLKDIEENSKIRGNIVPTRKGEQPVKALTANKDALGRKFVIDFGDSGAEKEKSAPAVNKTGTGAQKRIKIENGGPAAAVGKPSTAPVRSSGEISFLAKSGVKGTGLVLAEVALRQRERNGLDEEEGASSSTQASAVLTVGVPSVDTADASSGASGKAVDVDDDDDEGQEWED